MLHLKFAFIDTFLKKYSLWAVGYIHVHAA